MVSRVDRFTETQKQQTRYSDFFNDLTSHPNTLDLTRNTNEDAVIKSIRNLINTNKGERLMQPKIGSNIRSLLFEPVSPITAKQIKQFVIESIGNFEPRAKVIDVAVTDVAERNLYSVSVNFYVINIPDPLSINVNLYRVR